MQPRPAAPATRNRATTTTGLYEIPRGKLADVRASAWAPRRRKLLLDAGPASASVPHAQPLPTHRPGLLNGAQTRKVQRPEGAAGGGDAGQTGANRALTGTGKGSRWLCQGKQGRRARKEWERETARKGGQTARGWRPLLVCHTAVPKVVGGEGVDRRGRREQAVFATERLDTRPCH